MGNTPCVSPNSEVHPHGEHGVTYYVQSDLPQDNSNTHLQQKKHDTASKSPNSALFQFSTSDLLDGSFYALHLEDRPEKCILDAKQIVTCLVQQAEALVQRELASEQQQEQQQQEQNTASNTHQHRQHNTSSIPSDEDNEDDDNSIQESEEEEEDDSFEETESFSYHSTYHRKPRHMRIPEECDEPYDDGNGHPHNPRPHHSQHYPYDESTSRPLSPSNASSAAASSLWSVVTGGDVSTSLSAATPIHANVVSPHHQQQQHRRRRRGRTRGAQSSSSKNKFLSRSSKSKMAPPRLLGKDVDLDNTLHQDLVKVIDAITQEEEAAAAVAHPKGLVAGCLTTTSSLRVTRSAVPRQAKMHMITLHLRMRARCARYVPSHILQILPTHPFVEEDISQSANANQHHPHRFQSTKYKHANNSMNWDDIDEDHDPMIGEGPPSQAIRLLVDDETPFLDLGITGSLGLVDRPRRRGLPEHYTVLLNRRSGAPLAVCALKQSPFSSEADPVVRIYATKRRAYGQRPAASTRKLGLDWCGDASFPLYPWAEIVSEGRYPHRVQYSIYMATGNDGRFDESPSYLAEHSPRNATEIRIVGKTERESQYSGCATLCLSRQDENMDIMGQDDLFFRLSVVKGVDPALFLCFAAFVDESMEKTMRIQVSAERNYGIKSISV